MTSARLAILALILLSISGCKKDDSLVVGKIQRASKLCTAEFKVDKLVFGVKNKRILWFIPLNQAEFLAKSQAVVKTGVNLEKLKEEDVKVEGKKISLKLPAVEVINFSYPAESFDEIDLLTKNVFTTKISLADQEDFFRDAELDIRSSLEHMDIIETTEVKTRLMIHALLENLGYTEIYISFHKGELIQQIPEVATR